MATRSVVIAALLVGLVGCATADPPQIGGSAPPFATAPAAATQQPLPSSSGAASPSPTVALAELLPTSLNGVELHTFAVGGDVVDRLGSTLGIEPTAIEAAYASEHGARFFQTYALRVPGADGPRLLEAFVASAYDPSEGEVTRDEATVGGRSVTVVTQPTTAARLGTFYAYLIDDVLLVVQSFDPLLADEVIAALP